MKTRESIIRLQRFRVDESRRKLQALEGMKAELEKKSGELEVTVAAEQRRAIEDEIGRYAYPGFARAINARRENIVKSIEAVEAQIAAAQEELNAAYRDLKKFELAEEGRVREIKTRKSRREQNETDDLTLTRFVNQRAPTGQN
jgi:flagellar export protein FliJ